MLFSGVGLAECSEDLSPACGGSGGDSIKVRVASSRVILFVERGGCQTINNQTIARTMDVAALREVSSKLCCVCLFQCYILTLISTCMSFFFAIHKL